MRRKVAGPNFESRGRQTGPRCLAMLVCLWSVAGIPVPADPSPEQEVIQVLIEKQVPDTNGTTWDQVVLETTATTQLDLRRDYPLLRANLILEGRKRGPACSEAVEDMLKKNQSEAAIRIQTNRLEHVRLVGVESFERIFAGKEDTYDEWVRFYAEFPNGRHLLVVSRVGFDSRKTRAAVCFSVRKPEENHSRARYEIFRRQGERWVVDRYPRRYIKGRLTPGLDDPLIVLECELRYYLVDTNEPPASLHPSSLEVLKNEVTNLVCSVSNPFTLASIPVSSRQVRGFVLQVVEPKDVAGQVLTVRADPLRDPADQFEFEQRYELQIRREMLGNLEFRLF